MRHVVPRQVGIENTAARTLNVRLDPDVVWKETVDTIRPGDPRAMHVRCQESHRQWPSAEIARPQQAMQICQVSDKRPCLSLFLHILLAIGRSSVTFCSREMPTQLGMLPRPSTVAGQLFHSHRHHPARCSTHSNCSAAVRLMNPSTITTISHGRRLCRAVRCAPPLVVPLCCASRRAGFGVDPT